MAAHMALWDMNQEIDIGQPQFLFFAKLDHLSACKWSKSRTIFEEDTQFKFLKLRAIVHIFKQIQYSGGKSGIL